MPTEGILRRELMVKPSESNANQELPLTLLTAQMIEIATDHANQLGIGFVNLEPKGVGWVLSRLSIEMTRWPKTGEKYVLSTWIESYNPHFSERCFSVTDLSGNPLGYGRTVWVIIDLQTHGSMGTAGTHVPDELIAKAPCPMPRMAKHRPFEPERKTEYVFKYTDIDFYRHVNTVRYISLLLNQITLDEFDTHLLSRFDIAFAHEAKYGETAVIKSICEETETPKLLKSPVPSQKHTFELSVGERQVLSASIVLSKL